MADRPTTDVADVILDSMDRMFATLISRLEGLTDEEYLWEPVAGGWSVRETDDGPRVDGASVREVDPAPVTTIAWRLHHIAIDCLDDYTRRFAGNSDDASSAWTFSSSEAVATLEEKWAAYRATVVSKGFWTELGPDWEHWAKSSRADMAMHASNELVHHGAEISLLRDLYKFRE